MKKLGKRLKDARAFNNMTTRDVEASLKISNISRYENGLVEPRFSTMVRLARFYDVDILHFAEMVK